MDQRLIHVTERRRRRRNESSIKSSAGECMPTWWRSYTLCRTFWRRMHAGALTTCVSCSPRSAFITVFRILPPHILDDSVLGFPRDRLPCISRVLVSCYVTFGFFFRSVLHAPFQYKNRNSVSNSIHTKIQITYCAPVVGANARRRVKYPSLFSANAPSSSPEVAGIVFK